MATHHKCKETVLGLALGVALGVASRSGRRRSGQPQAKLSCEGLSTLFGMLRILMPGSKLKMLTSELLLNCLVGDHIEPWWMSLFPSRERETAPGSAKNAALFLVEGDNLEGRPGQSCPLSLGWTLTDPQRFSDQEQVHRLLLTALKAEVLLAEGCCIRQGLSRQRTNMWRSCGGSMTWPAAAWALLRGCCVGARICMLHARRVCGPPCLTWTGWQGHQHQAAGKQGHQPVTVSSTTQLLRWLLANADANNSQGLLVVFNPQPSPGPSQICQEFASLAHVLSKTTRRPPSTA